jgi:excisionase family DNA binding protein
MSPATAMNQPMLTLPEVADLLRLSQKSVYRLAQARKLPSIKVGGSWRFPQKELHAWIATKLRAKRTA